MRPLLLAALALALAGSAAADGGGPARHARKTKYYVAYDYYLPGTSGDGLRDFNTTLAGNLDADGFTDIASHVDKKGGVGFRVGALHPLDPHAFLGGSLGYIVGPNVSSQLTANSPGVGTGSATINENVGLLRAMVETSLRFPLGERCAFNLGTGWGLSFGKIEQTCTGAGTLAGTTACSSAAESRTWTGVTFDLTPSLSYRLDRAEVNLSLRYTSIPRYGGTASIAPIDWKTVGMALGASF